MKKLVLAAAVALALSLASPAGADPQLCDSHNDPGEWGMSGNYIAACGGTGGDFPGVKVPHLAADSIAAAAQEDN